MMYACRFKRYLDIIISLIVILLISPLLLVTMTCLYFVNKNAGIFFFQQRPGKNGKIFKVIKFKTMTDDRDPDGNLLPDEERLTQIGKFVRASSIDIQRGKPAGMKSVRESPVGRRSMAVMRFLGRRSLNWMCGTWTTAPFCLT